MSEPMREITEEIDLRPLADAYPNARKVTVDMAAKTAYVFTGRSLRATTITGAEFDELVKVLPGKAGQSNAADQSDDQADGKPAEVEAVEAVEAVISVVKEEPDVQEVAPKKRGK